MSPNLGTSEEVQVGKDSDECTRAAAGRGDGARGEGGSGDRGCGDHVGIELPADKAGVATVSAQGSPGAPTPQCRPAIESSDRAGSPPPRAGADPEEVRRRRGDAVRAHVGRRASGGGRRGRRASRNLAPLDAGGGALESGPEGGGAPEPARE